MMKLLKDHQVDGSPTPINQNPSDTTSVWNGGPNLQGEDGEPYVSYNQAVHQAPATVR